MLTSDKQLFESYGFSDAKRGKHINTKARVRVQQLFDGVCDSEYEHNISGARFKNLFIISRFALYSGERSIL